MNITKIAIAAGDKVYAMEEAEKMGSQAYFSAICMQCPSSST
ncbi:hypothetical protein [Fictibacillus barbaricus]|nr:hypothetical protein [Fictibacillus barbaricus]